MATFAGVARMMEIELRLSAFRFPFSFRSFFSFVVASQRVRPEVAGPMTSSAKKSSRTARLLHRRTVDSALDCFVAFAPRNDAFHVGFATTRAQIRSRERS
jgi:hypothetical protein